MTWSKGSATSQKVTNVRGQQCRVLCHLLGVEIIVTNVSNFVHLIKAYLTFTSDLFTKPFIEENIEIFKDMNIMQQNMT